MARARSVFLVQELLVVRAPELKDEPRRPFLAHPLQEKCLDAGRELAMHADALLEELREGRGFGESVEAEADFFRSKKKYVDTARALVKEFFGTLAAKDLAKSGFKPRFRSGMLGRLSKQFPHDLLMLLDYCDFSLARRPGMYWTKRRVTSLLRRSLAFSRRGLLLWTAFCFLSGSMRTTKRRVPFPCSP